MNIQCVASMSRFLNVPHDEIIRHAKAAVDISGNAANLILTAKINSAGEVSMLDKPEPLPPETLIRATPFLHKTKTTFAARVKATAGPLSMLEDAILLFIPTDGIERDAVGKLSIVRLKNGQQYLCNILQVQPTGEAILCITDGSLEFVLIQSATKIICIIP